MSHQNSSPAPKQTKEQVAQNEHPQHFSGFYYPANIWLDKNLKAIEKNLLAEVYSLEQLPKGCVASNEHFALRLNINSRSVSRHLDSLKKREYLIMTRFNGRYRKLRINPAKLDPHQIIIDSENVTNASGSDKLSMQTGQIVDAASTNMVTNVSGVDKLSMQTGQFVDAASTNCRPTIVNNKSTKYNSRARERNKKKTNSDLPLPEKSVKKKTKTKKAKQESEKKDTQTCLPFSSEKFEVAWNNWLAYRREIKKPYKSIISIRQTLDQLAKFEETFAIELIEKSITNSWQGLIFSGTDKQYKEWLANKHKTNIPPQGTGTRAKPQTNLMDTTRQINGVCHQLSALEKQQKKFKDYPVHTLEALAKQLRELWHKAKNLQMFGSELSRITALGQQIRKLIDKKSKQGGGQ